ncbi:SNF2-related protein [Penicillium griseofulvum]|uniref:SNF2-related protein n=1 Tax=Penicillium patulum TaxID=5078 RepID=A0A135LHC0_PENPA|nr:SNF2-related protein [Penicillium griseofulvum]KXG48353.1 SNF2-related protein [Penicillium griseofulvum]
MASHAAMLLNPKGSKRQAQSNGNDPFCSPPASDLSPVDDVAMSSEPPSDKSGHMTCAAALDSPGSPGSSPRVSTLPCVDTMDASAVPRDLPDPPETPVHLDTEMDAQSMHTNITQPAESGVSDAPHMDTSVMHGEFLGPADSFPPCALNSLDSSSSLSSHNLSSPVISPPTDPMLLDSIDSQGSLLEGPGKQQGNGSYTASPIAPVGTATTTRFEPPTSRTSPSVASEISTPAMKSEPSLTVQFSTTHDEDNESDTKRSYREMSDDQGITHRPNLIENVYGVEKRKNQPTKKMKTEHDVEEKANMATAPASISGDSGLGKWMKEEDVKPTPISTTSNVVDLTADLVNTPKDDDEVLCTGSTDLSAQRVCYGKVESAMVMAYLVPKPGPSVYTDWSHAWPSIKLDLHRRAEKGNFKIEVADPHGRIFGTIDPKTAQGLCPLLDSEEAGIEVKALLDVRRTSPNEEIWHPTSGLWRASLNIYGQRKNAEAIGNFLSHRNVWLGTPNSVDKGTTVFNPHAESRRQLAAANAAANSSGRSRPGPGIRYEARTAEEANDAVMKMFDQLANANIPTMEPSHHIETPLLHHQKQALWFMTEKEKPRKFGRKEEDNNSLWRMENTPNGKTQYREIITGMISEQKPEEALGGLLADMMGLGKTLSILSLITSSLSLADDWTEMAPDPVLVRRNPGIRNTRTTLLVVPLSAVSNWVTQIKDHLKPRSISYYIFHGPSRITDFNELSEFDIIITTYSTVLSEISGRGARSGKLSPLTKMNMFRIVLDEAHIIREQNAAQTKAILGLHSERRWSVTGTPIQNRMEDLLSVTRFLRIVPYDQRSQFSQHISSPVKNGDPNVLARLRVLVDSFTLRRVKDKINLPPRKDNIITLRFTEKEQQLHDFFRAESNVMMSVIAGEDKRKMGGRMYHHVLKAMMILRQVSAHGKELLDISDRERIKGLSVNDAIDLEEGEPDETRAAIDKKAYEMFDLMQQNSVPRCGNCNRELDEPLNSVGAVARDAPMAIALPCHDIFCPGCFSGWKHTFDSCPDTQTRCPRCEGWIHLKYSTITPAGFEEYQAQKESERQTRKLGKNLGDYEGPHTKTIALVNYLKESVEDSKQLEGESPIKSVVFSGWTSHLDLIEVALKNNGLDGFVRLDGTMALSARTKALEEFAKNDHITVLLATIGAGGVALNLTSASRVFIMEPQYNPAAVAQAIDRVHRLGQTRPVQTYQFVMKDSIEEKIMDLAKKKQEMADTSLNRAKQDKRETQEARMREYRSLFK